MSRPKGKMIALLAVFVAIALVAATGAFTSVEAERTVSVNVSDDSDALLALEPSDTSNGDYATTVNGEVVIDLDNPSGIDGGDESPAGINDNATTKIFYIVNVTNQGTQDVGLSASVSNEESSVGVTVVSNTTDATPNDANLTAEIVGPLSPGEQVSLGLVLDATNANGASFNETITLTADEADA